MDRLDEVFERQLRLQRESFGVDPAEVAGLDRERYLTQNALALVVELAEAINEANWKMWVHGVEPGSFHDRDAFVKELVDILHFLVNLFLVAGASSTEVYNRYLRKADVNAQRQLDGYDGRSTKDADGRALDEPDWRETEEVTDR